jgi:hypothetical protein
MPKNITGCKSVYEKPSLAPGNSHRYNLWNGSLTINYIGYSSNHLQSRHEKTGAAEDVVRNEKFRPKSLRRLLYASFRQNCPAWAEKSYRVAKKGVAKSLYAPLEAVSGRCAFLFRDRLLNQAHYILQIFIVRYLDFVVSIAEVSNT